MKRSNAELLIAGGLVIAGGALLKAATAKKGYKSAYFNTAAQDHPIGCGMILAGGTLLLLPMAVKIVS